MKARILFMLAAGVLLAGLILSSTGAQEGPGKDTSRVDGSPAYGPGEAREVEAFFDGLVPKQLREGHVAGATVSVVKDGRPVFAKGYGYADLEEREPVVADETLFYPGSAGKLFTWTAVMQLVEKGEIDLDADINTYLDFEVPDTYSEPITMSELMTHTAGFEEQFAAQMVSERRDVLPIQEFLARNMPERVYPPGRYFAYSNYGTALAGYVVGRVSGEPYEQYVEENILRTLGMEDSSASQPLPGRLDADLSKGYRYDDGTYDAVDVEWVSAAPAAPVHATATDMSRFMLAHLENGGYGGARVLREETAIDMHRRHFTHDPRLPGVAYGFMISRANDQRILLHDGESARFSTLVALLPDERTGLFVSYNTPFDAHETLTAFMDHFYPGSGNEIPSTPTASGSRVWRFEGTYVPARVAHTGPQKVVGWLDPIRISAESEDLLLRTPFGDQRYVETEPGAFEQVDGEWSLVFREEGGVTRLFMGPLPLAYFEAPWYRTLRLQLPLIAACMALFVSALVVWPVTFFVRRWRKAGLAPSGAARMARWLAGVLGAINLVLSVWFVLALLGFAETYVWPAQTVTTITRLWLLVLPLTLGVAILAAWAWKDRFWNAMARIHYTLVALAGVLFILLLFHWNLVGY